MENAFAIKGSEESIVRKWHNAKRTALVMEDVHLENVYVSQDGKTTSVQSFLLVLMIALEEDNAHMELVYATLVPPD